MFVSIVVPCYNAALYIKKCLKSFENQSFKDFEVIVVDDKSTDNSLDVLNDCIKDTNIRIKVLSNSVNVGPSASRLKAIEESKSEFICFCDSDDWYDTNYMQEMVDAQERMKADIVFCSFRLVFDSGKAVDRLNLYKKVDLQDTKRTLIKAPDSLCLMMVRRELLLKVSHPDLRNGEDMALIPLLVGISNRFASVNKCLYNYYCREGSASMKPSMKMIESLEQSFLFVEKNLSSSFTNEIEFIGIRNLIYGTLINLFKFSNNVDKANNLLESFEKKYPSWIHNSYMKELSASKRIFLKMVYYRRWFWVRLVAQMHGFLLNH